VALLTKLGLRTAYDFAVRSEAWAEKLLGKIGRELWGELRGEAVYPVTTEEKSTYFTISKRKAFTSPSADREFVLAKLLRNLESGCIKLRRHQLRARSLAVMLRKKDYSQAGLEARLDRATASTQEVVPLVTQLFEQLYCPGAEYRSTMVVLGRLESDRERQRELFEDNVRIEKLEAASATIDAVNKAFGKHKLCLGTALFLNQHQPTDRDIQPWRKSNLLAGETERQHLKIPRWAITV
jgi:hypothetical protein